MFMSEWRYSFRDVQGRVTGSPLDAVLAMKTAA